jgi:hypothetical protein
MTNEPRWTTIVEIEHAAASGVRPVFFRSLYVSEEAGRFAVYVKLRWWTKLALGFIHRHYQRKLQAQCDAGKPVAIIGQVFVR